MGPDLADASVRLPSWSGLCMCHVLLEPKDLRAGNEKKATAGRGGDDARDCDGAVAVDGTTTAQILQKLQEATNTILNTKIRIN